MLEVYLEMGKLSEPFTSEQMMPNLQTNVTVPTQGVSRELQGLKKLAQTDDPFYQELVARALKKPPEIKAADVQIVENFRFEDGTEGPVSINKVTGEVVQLGGRSVVEKELTPEEKKEEKLDEYTKKKEIDLSIKKREEGEKIKSQLSSEIINLRDSASSLRNNILGQGLYKIVDGKKVIDQNSEAYKLIDANVGAFTPLSRPGFYLGEGEMGGRAASQQWRASFEQFKANKVFERLGAIKKAGSTLGAISAPELLLLEKGATDLTVETSPELFIQKVEEILSNMDKYEKRIIKEYKRKYNKDLIDLESIDNIEIEDL